MPLLDRTESRELALAKGYFFCCTADTEQIFISMPFSICMGAFGFFCLAKACPKNDLTFVVSSGLCVITHIPKGTS